MLCVMVCGRSSFDPLVPHEFQTTQDRCLDTVSILSFIVSTLFGLMTIAVSCFMLSIINRRDGQSWPCILVHLASRSSLVKEVPTGIKQHKTTQALSSRARWKLQALVSPRVWIILVVPIRHHMQRLYLTRTGWTEQLRRIMQVPSKAVMRSCSWLRYVNQSYYWHCYSTGRVHTGFQVQRCGDFHAISAKFQPVP